MESDCCVSDCLTTHRFLMYLITFIKFSFLFSRFPNPFLNNRKPSTELLRCKTILS